MKNDTIFSQYQQHYQSHFSFHLFGWQLISILKMQTPPTRDSSRNMISLRSYVSFSQRWDVACAHYTEDNNLHVKTIPSMKNLHIIFRGVWPYIQFNNPHSSPQSLYDGDIAAVTTELIPSQIGIVTRKYEIMRQWCRHIMVHLEHNQRLPLKALQFTIYSGNLIT